MQVIERDILELRPYENNPRKNLDAVDAVAESIRAFGFQQPIVVDRDDVIIAGHTRYQAALKLNMTSVPVVKADELTPEQVRAYRLADNKTGELATWDFEKLELELQALETYDMELFGFDKTEEDQTSEISETEYDGSLPDEPRTKLGDMYQLGEHRLICGDSTDVGVIDRLLDGIQVDMIYTDPPYGMDLDTDFSSMKTRLEFVKDDEMTGGRRYDPGQVDDFDPDMINAVFTIPAREIFLWGADYYAELLPDRNAGSWIVWDKRANGTDDEQADYRSDKMYGSCFELCWSKRRHKRDIARIKWAGVFGMESEFDHKRHHPTQKPIKLAAWFLERYSRDGHVIADLFGGSGSTLLACEQMNRRCLMCELDPRYVDVIIDRWEALTGDKAVLIDGT